MEGLKPEWRIFAEQYVIDWNGTRSYQVAYPSSSYEAAMSSASDLLRNPKINEYIEEIQKDLAKLAGISALSNILELKKILEGIDEEDNPKERAADRIKAIEVINKMVGLNAPDKVDSNIKIDLNKISDKDLDEQIKNLK